MIPIPPRAWLWLAGLLLVAGAAAAGRYAIHLRDEANVERGRGEVRALWERARQTAQDEEDRKAAGRRREQQEAQDANARALALLAADAAGSRAAAGRLQQRVDTLESAARRQACGDRSPAGDGQAAGDPIGVLAELQRRADERAGVLAAYADRARAAGALCERLYDALTASP